MRLSAAVLATTLLATAAGAREVGFPLVVDHALLRASLAFCFAPLSWKGNVESVARPEIGGDWRLRLRDLDSHLYDAAGRRTTVASGLWDVVKGRLESELTTFAFDLAPPVEDARGLI